MKNLKLTQEYLICILGENGKPAFLGNERVLLVGAALTELLGAGIVRLDEKKSKIFVEKALSDEQSHLAGLYRYLSNKRRTTSQLATDYCFSLSEKLFDELMESVCEDLVQAQYVESKSSGILRNKKIYLPKPETVEEIKSQIQAKNLDNADEKQLTLAFLLEKANRLKKLFDKEEVTAIREKIKIQSAHHEAIQKMITFLDELIIVLAALGAMSV
ncbi:MAG: GPP34 family phosphoprotein [Peptostreptococcaceae bacterium]|nr:GPP34 family phosphoprotein [Peptostreptococcaceae bacterium]